MMPSDLRLQIELVPSTAWWSNVRSNVRPRDWERCKNFVKNRSQERCEICGGRGRRYPVDCHEIWDYDDDRRIQTLVDLIALCPACHEVKHYGRASGLGRGAHALAHFMNVNELQDLQWAERYIEYVFRVWRIRSQVTWKLDVSFLTRELGIELPASLDRELVREQ